MPKTQTHGTTTIGILEAMLPSAYSGKMREKKNRRKPFGLLAKALGGFKN
jgi:hypothetical protein